LGLGEEILSQLLRAFALSVCFTATTLALSQEQAAAQVLLRSGSNSASASSWVAGAHAGYNWQQGSAVFGVEGDLQATNLKSSMTGGLTYNPPQVPPPTGDFAETSSSIDWYGTLRGRLGIASGSWLLYGTAGLAYGDVGLSSRFGTTGLSLNSQVSELKTGWVAGAGIEYLWRPNVSFRASYQYVDLGTLRLSSSTPVGILSMSQTANANAQLHAVTAGISWHFGPTQPSAPWAGGYAGGHAGGAWGNDTDAIYGLK